MIELSKVLPIILKMVASGLSAPLQRNSALITALKKVGWNREHPPADFSSIYAHALVDYAVGGEVVKTEPLVKLFGEDEIKQAFRTASDQGDLSPLVEALGKRLNWQAGDEEWNFIAYAIEAENLDIQAEVRSFYDVFGAVVARSETPKERYQLLKLDELMQRLSQLEPAAMQVGETQSSSAAQVLAAKLDGWFKALNYGRESYECFKADYCEWIITIPTRRGFDRILVRCIESEAWIFHLRALQQASEQHRPTECWLVSTRQISSAVQEKIEGKAYAGLYCYTLDDVIDQVVDFSQYWDWLENEVETRGIAEGYIPLGCRNPKTKVLLGTSRYGESEGWIEEHVDQWLADSSKRHLSVLGESGTGKTWFVMHYAWQTLQEYKEAKKRGLERPRLPLVIPLRDYAEAVSMESLFSEFFFHKYEIPLPGYTAFEQLNKMGKLLLIFDGFNEMAARVDLQAMTDNFWELARVVVPGAKAILTCRTEHFPDAIEGQATLSAEKKASTANLTGEPPQFEALELEKFDDEQIRELLEDGVSEKTTKEVMENPQLLELARWPVMVDLILEALPEIEAGRAVDMSRVYLYAVKAKMERDIRSERTSMSLADKLYFVCELSWEMLSTNRMSLNYRALPERLQQMFTGRLQEEKELDHWRYNMMGQTILTCNLKGDYSPAHRPLLEFFVAYKIVASLGAMAEDFTAVAQNQSHLDEALPSQNYTWDSYFKRECDDNGEPVPMARLNQFEGLTFGELLPLLGQTKLAKAVLELAHPMLNEATMREQLLPLLQTTASRTLKESGYLGGNTAQLMLAKTPHALIDADLRGSKLQGTDFAKTYLRRVNLREAQLAEAPFSKVLGNVNSVAYSPDGRHLAIGDSKGVLQVWEMATGQVVLFCTGHKAAIKWVIATGQVVLFCAGHKAAIQSVAYSPDGQQLASASADKTVQLWNAATGDCTSTLIGHENWVLSVVYSPDGQQLASASADRTVKLWNAATGDCTNTLIGHWNRVESVVYSPDGRQLASASADRTVKLWNAATGDCTNTLIGHWNRVESVVYSPDGQQLASTSYDKRVKLWNAATGDCTSTLQGHGDCFLSVVYSSDGRQLASATYDGTSKLWNAATGDCTNTLIGHGDCFLSVVYSPDGRQLASASYDRTVKLWNAAIGDCTSTLQGHKSWVRSVVYSPDGQQLASASTDNTLKLWNAATGDCTSTLQGHKYSVWSVVYSPDGRQLASASADKTVKLWNAATGDCTSTLIGHKSWVKSVMYSPDGQQLASASADKTVKLWNAATGNCTSTLQGHENSVWSVVYSPDGQQLASASADKTVKLWNAAVGYCTDTLQGHENWVLSVVYSPDGQQLASASTDNTVKLWNAATGDCTSTLQGHENWVLSVVYSPDGQQLASASYDNTLRIWDVNTGECLRVISDRVCEGLDITGTIGLSPGQRTALKLMGAIDHNDE